MSDRTRLIKNDIVNLSPTKFISKWIIDAVPVIFEEDYTSYLDWRNNLSKKIGVDPNDIFISGSASIGFSLNPNNNLKKFNDTSDVDICIISENYFNTAWYELRSIKPYHPSMQNSKFKAAIENHRTKYIYWGTIATDRILPILSFGQKWDLALKSSTDDKHFGSRDLNFRIYKDNKSFRDYTIISVSKCRQKILEGK